jgi:transformation/transcription domain-associated protein
MLASYLDAMTYALAREDADQARKAHELISTIVRDLIATRDSGEFTPPDVVFILSQIASRFSRLCYDDFWFRKSAGCNGIKMLTCTPDLGVQWINDREVDLVRTLIHVLKDLPSDLPRDVDDVIDILTRVLRVSRGDGDMSEANNAERSKVGYLVGILFAELSSPNPVVRRASQTGIHLIAELTGKPATEHMMPYRERMLTTIFNKPLRALPFNMQIGMLEAIRFCVCLTPPLLEVTEELLRLIHEALALADADDANLIGQRSDRQRSMDLIKLRVACITLLTASMPMMDFYAKHPTTRQRLV